MRFTITHREKTAHEETHRNAFDSDRHLCLGR